MVPHCAGSGSAASGAGVAERGPVRAMGLRSERGGGSDRVANAMCHHGAVCDVMLERGGHGLTGDSLCGER